MGSKLHSWLLTYCLLTQQLYPTPPFNGTILSNFLLCFNGKSEHDETLSKQIKNGR